MQVKKIGWLYKIDAKEITFTGHDYLQDKEFLRGLYWFVSSNSDIVLGIAEFVRRIYNPDIANEYQAISKQTKMQERLEGEWTNKNTGEYPSLM